MALALRLGERKAVPQRLAITATVTLDETRALTMTFNPDAMDLRPCRRSALLTRRVVGE
jgi:hypothetical protein